MNLGKWPLGKCFFIIDRKAPATLVETPRLNGVLPECFFLPNFLGVRKVGLMFDQINETQKIHFYTKH